MHPLLFTRLAGLVCGLLLTVHVQSSLPVDKAEWVGRAERAERAERVGLAASGGDVKTLLPAPVISGVSYRHLLRQLRRQNAIRNDGGRLGSNARALPHHVYAVTEVQAGVCGEPRVLSWFDYQGAESERDYASIWGRYLAKGSCPTSAIAAGSSVPKAMLIPVFGTSRWIYDNLQREDASTIDRHTRKLLDREQTLPLETVESMLSNCRYDCERSVFWFTALMLVAADAYDAEGRTQEAALWREEALKSALGMEFFRRREKRVLARHAIARFDYARRQGEVYVAAESLQIAREFAQDDQLTALKRIEDSYAQWTVEQRQEPFSRRVSLVKAQPFYSGGGAASERLLHPIFSLSYEAETLEYAFVLCEGKQYPVNMRQAQKWRLPESVRSCRLLLLGSPDARLTLTQYPVGNEGDAATRLIAGTP